MCYIVIYVCIEIYINVFCVFLVKSFGPYLCLYYSQREDATAVRAEQEVDWL